ncbi:MAG: hypothetical protein LUD50_05075 [Clostridia bacterium]|nr:hypothetical protein [Clostridia bacterium]
MFVGRRIEMQAVYDFLEQPGGVALVCGKCGQGKSEFMREIFGSYRKDDTIFFYPMSDGLEKNEMRLQDGIMDLGYELCNPQARRTLEESFRYLDGDNDIVVIDNFQRLAENGNYELLGETFSKIFSQYTKTLHVFIIVPDHELKKLRLEQNIMGKLDLVLHLDNMSYLECAGFYPDYTPYDKALMYAVCGGSPYINDRMEAKNAPVDNIIRLLNMSNAIFWHTYFATGAPANEAQAYPVLHDLAVGKRVYAGEDIPADDETARQLARLEAEGAVRRTTPVGDMQRSWYEITDGTVMFKYRYIYGWDKEHEIESWGHGDCFYECHVKEDFASFFALRFTQMCREYFSLQREVLAMDGVTAIGTWCHKRDLGCRIEYSEYEVALQRGNDIEVYIPICSREKATRDMLEKRTREAALDGLSPSSVGFISLSGFEPDCEGIPNLITGEDLYEDLGV